jgi:acetylornithine deacetylase/succinyl-diaminopimelate desuccinylase-like protein
MDAATSSWVAAVAAAVDREFDAECAFLAELVRIPTDNPPGDCAKHAEKAAALLENLGYVVQRLSVPDEVVRAAGMRSATNLIVRKEFGSGGPCIALNAHGDVVPPGQGWTQDPYGGTVVPDPIQGPTMYGRGVAVRKSDFATYTYALRAIEQLARAGQPLRGTIELHFTYDEEVGGNIGPRWLLEQGFSKPDFAIGGGFSYAVTTAHNGCLHLEVIVRRGEGDIAAECDVDALAAATHILQALYDSRETLGSRESSTPGIDHSTLSIGLIEGGVDASVVPERVTFHIDRRIIPEESPAEAEEELRALIERAAAECFGIEAVMRRVLLAQPLTRSLGAEPLICALQKYGKAFFGVDIPERGAPLYTDARHYAAAGVPVVLYGAGPRTLVEANGHAADECLRLDDLRGATKTVACTLADLLGAHASTDRHH